MSKTSKEIGEQVLDKALEIDDLITELIEAYSKEIGPWFDPEDQSFLTVAANIFEKSSEPASEFVEEHAESFTKFMSSKGTEALINLELGVRLLRQAAISIEEGR